MPGDWQVHRSTQAVFQKSLKLRVEPGGLGTGHLDTLDHEMRLLPSDWLSGSSLPSTPKAEEQQEVCKLPTAIAVCPDMLFSSQLRYMGRWFCSRSAWQLSGCVLIQHQWLFEVDHILEPSLSSFFPLN